MAPIAEVFAFSGVRLSYGYSNRMVNRIFTECNTVTLVVSLGQATSSIICFFSDVRRFGGLRFECDEVSVVATTLYA